MSNCKCQEVISKIAELEAKIEEMVLANSRIVSKIANNIELKLDILANSEQIALSQKPSKKVRTRIAFFKDLFKEDINKYNNILYTQDRVAEIMSLDEVKSKKTDAAKASKAADFLYKDFKNNKEFSDKLDELYQEYKNEVEASTAEEEA